MPHLHFEGPRNARAKERILSRLLTCIAIAVEARGFGLVENMEVGDDYPIPPSPRRNPQGGRKRPREPSSHSPIDSCPCVRLAPLGNS